MLSTQAYYIPAFWDAEHRHLSLSFLEVHPGEGTLRTQRQSTSPEPFHLPLLLSHTGAHTRSEIVLLSAASAFCC